jgi:type I restriction enzyme S subunit
MSHWRGSARLGDVASFVRGVTFKPEDVVPAGTPGAVWCMRTKNVQARIDLSDVWAIGSQFVKRSDQYLQAGDLLVSSANSWNLVGKCCWVPELGSPSTFGGFISVLRADRGLIDPRYLYHWFASKPTQSKLRSFGRQTTNISNLDLARSLDLPIPLPPMETQRRIAETLDQIDGLREKRQEVIALFDQLAQSIFLDMFGSPAANPMGWGVSRLDAVARFFGGASLPTGAPYSGQEDGYLLVKVSDMNLPGNEIWLNKSHQWSGSPGARSATCPKGAVILPKRGAAIATNKKRISSLPSILDPNLMGIWPLPESLDIAYLYHWFLSFDLTSITNGSSVPQLNKQDLAPLTIPLPPIKLQVDFASKVSTVRSHNACHLEQLNEMDALLNTLQHRAFVMN